MKGLARNAIRGVRIGSRTNPLNLGNDPDYHPDHDPGCTDLHATFTRSVSKANEQSINFGGALQSLTDFLVLLCDPANVQYRQSTEM